MIREKEKDSLCQRLNKKGSKFWKRWRKGLSSWLTTAGYVSAAAAFTRNRSILGFLWRGGPCIFTSSKLDFNLNSVALLAYHCFLNRDVFSAGMSLWTTWMLCVSPHSRMPLSVTPVRTQPLQVTTLRAGTRSPATALEQYYPREIHPWIPLIMQGVQFEWI